MKISYMINEKRMKGVRGGGCGAGFVGVCMVVVRVVVVMVAAQASVRFYLTEDHRIGNCITVAGWVPKLPGYMAIWVPKRR